MSCALSLLAIGWLAGAAAVTDQPWCHGIQWDALTTRLYHDSSVDVFYAQAPLFSNNPSIGGKLGALGMFHTALVFQQGDLAWTLEYDLTAQNKAGRKFSAGYLPEIQGDGSSAVLTWDTDARWCLTEGVLLNRSHWTKQYSKFAEISTVMFQKVVDEFVPSLNGTNNRNSSGVGFAYNVFQMTYGFSVTMQDVTCGNGAIWVRDYLIGIGASVNAIDWRSSRVVLPAAYMLEVDKGNAKQWSAVVAYFRGLSDLINGNATVDQKISNVKDGFPVRFWYDAARDRYLQIFAIPNIQYIDSGFPFPVPQKLAVSGADASLSLVV